MESKNNSESSECRKKLLALREKLLAVEQDRMDGRAGVTMDEFDTMLDKAINKSK